MTTHESDAAPSRRAAPGTDETTGVVTLLHELAPHLDVEPDPAFRQATRQRLVAMAAVRTPEPARLSPLRRLLTGRAPDAPAGRWRTRVTAGLAGAALTVTSLATLVALSTGAHPGDVLYGVKRGTEQTQLALAGDSRGQTLLDLARTRLGELDDLGGDAGLAESTLATMDRQTSEGAAWLASRAVDSSDAAPLDRLSGWADEQSARLTAARSEVPAPAADDVDDSLVLLTDITARADGLRAALACPPGPAVSGADRLGPVPAGCLPEPLGPADPGGSTDPLTGADVRAPVTGDPSAPQPAGPTGQPPAPGGGLPPAPAPSAGPAPTTAPGGGLPPAPLPLPSLLPSPTTPAPATAPPPPLIDLEDAQIGACLPPLLTLGDCRGTP